MTKLIRITTVPISLKVLLKGQHQYMSNCGFDVLGVSSPGLELEDVSKTEGIKVYPLFMTRTISPFRDLIGLWTFYKLCKKYKPHIVHSHTPKAGVIGMLGAKLAGVPLRLHTVAGMPLMESVGIRRKILDFVEKLIYSCATKVYPNSAGLRDFIVKNNYTSKKKLKVIGNGSSNGIDTSIFSLKNIDLTTLTTLKSTLQIDENDFVFVFIGRLVGDKGINELIEAFSTLGRPNVKLLLVGPFESALDPLKLTTQKEIDTNPNIISVGFQKDVRPYFAISHALVFPSYREGFPNVVMQAGAMELPAIVSNINGCNEIIVEGINGTIIPVKDSTAIRIALLKLLDDKQYYNNLKINSRKMIVDRYEQSVVWKALLEEYQELLANYKR
ncbi:glycosyltransferase family 4 protein [Sphingobacterium siyangense]|uniref:glycosyltransferase family 4 protein n=1 Tax=Sphingobacterium siyangense TaxID=459529 RepID=UPI003DA1CE2C